MALLTTFRQCAPDTTKFGKITQNKGHFAVSLQTFTTRHSNRKWSIVMALSTTFTQYAPKITKFLIKSRKIKAISPFKVIQGHRFWYQSKAHIRLPIND